MKRFLIFALFPFSAHAADVTVGTQPKAVFTPAPGGYILRQPGPSPLNLSTTPQPVTPPSQGIPGTGAFSGGKKFRVNGNDFEMGGKYDMPIPKTSKTVPVDAVSKVPIPAMAKKAMKMLPIVGNLYAAGDILDDLASYWDSQQPGELPAIAEPSKGTVSRQGRELEWVHDVIPGKFPSAASACSAAAKFDSTGQNRFGSATGSVDGAQGGTAPNFTARCSRSIVSGGNTYVTDAGITYSGLSLPKLTPVPESIVDSFSDTLTPSQAEDLINGILNTPGGDNLPWQLPEDSPTTVTGPSSAPVNTTTTTNSQGTTVNTTTTNITYNNNQIKITTNTTSVLTRPDGTTDTTNSQTDTTELPTDPNPQQSKPSDGLGLCDLFPDILACKKLEEPPQEEIPKQTQDITLQTGPIFSGGSCPPDVVVNVGGQQVTVLSTAQPCGWIESYMKPIILLLASISAAFIVLPRAD